MNSQETTENPTNADAAPILARMEQLLSEAQTASDTATMQRVRDDLVDVRRDLLEVVVARYNGDREAAAMSDDFEPEFKQMTAVITPPKPQPTRRFPGIEYKKQGER